MVSDLDNFLLSVVEEESQEDTNGTDGTDESKLFSNNKYYNCSINITNKCSKCSTKEYKKRWTKVRSYFDDSNTSKVEARHKTAKHLLKAISFKTHPISEQIYVFNSGTYKPKGDKIIKKEVRQYLGGKVTSYDIKEVLKAVKDVSFVEKEEFEQEELMINVENADIQVEDDGTLDVKEIDPERCILSRIPWEYDKDADCPEIKEFLKDVLKEDWIPTVQEMVGLTLANKYLTRKAFMLYGDGSNGKDILLDLIEELLTEENISHHTLHHLERNTFASAGLVGKLANVSGDLSEKELKTSSTFKRITGGSGIEVEPKGKDSYSYEPYSTMVFAANTTPSFKEGNYSLYDRWIIITFPYKFTDDPNDDYKDRVPREKLLKKLKTEEEMKGFLKWAIDGLKRLKGNNNVLTNQQAPEEIEEAWKERSGSITAFVKKKIEKNIENVIPKSKLHDIYRDWCVEKDYTPESQTKLSKQIPTKTPATADNIRIDGKKTRCFKGIAVVGREEEEDKDDEEEKSLDEFKDSDVKLEDIVDYIKKTDSGDGVEYKKLYDEFGEDIDDILDNMLSEGDIYEPNPKNVKLL